MFFTIKRELGFSRAEWDQLSWVDRQMYTEELSMHLYRESHSNWKQAPAGKRGPEPQAPVFKRYSDSPEYRKSGTQDPDIGSLEGMDIVDA